MTRPPPAMLARQRPPRRSRRPCPPLGAASLPVPPPRSVPPRQWASPASRWPRPPRCASIAPGPTRTSSTSSPPITYASSTRCPAAGCASTCCPAGAVVGALQLQDAVISGALDGGHGVTAYWYGKHKAFSLFGTPPPFGWDAHQFLAWFWTGGGKELYAELLEMLELPLVGYQTGPMPTQTLSWFKEPITSADDLRGLKYRTVGLGADLMNEFGAAVTIMGGGDIVPAMDRGLLDGAEFNNPSSDQIGRAPCREKQQLIVMWLSTCEAFEIMFIKNRHDSLPEEFQAILES